MGWRPTVGVLIPYVGGCYFTNLLAGIQRAAQRRGARVVAFQTAGLDVLWPAEANTLPLGWDAIDGWVGVNDLQGTALYELISTAGKPLVTVSTRLAGHGCCAVLPDNHDGVKEAVRHLIDHGHRRIAFAGSLNHTDIRERYEGYMAALLEAGITPDSQLFFPTPVPLEPQGRAVGKQLIADRIPCTAMIAGTDAIAIGVIDELQSAGFHVPQDVAIIGFDDIDRAQYVNPPLSTVQLRFDTLAETAADILLSIMLDGTPPRPLVRVRGSLIRRHSCGCAARPESVPAPSPSAALADDERARFASSLLAVVAGGRNLDVSLAGELLAPAETIARHLGALALGEQGLTSAEVQRAWRQLLAVAHEVETVETLLSLVEDTTTVWHRLVAPRRVGDPALQPLLRNLRFELMRAWRIVEQTRRRYADSNADANRKINLALVGMDLADAHELGWLRWTRVRHAALGEWRAATATAPRRLCIRSVFHAGLEPLRLLGSEHAPNQFPSAELCALLDDSGPDEIVNVVPITGRDRNRGLLTVIGPLEIELTDDTGNLELWAALLSAAMDREELMASLRRNALHDALTGLPNRALLMDRLEQAIARGQRAREARFAVLFLDLDHFKTLNDSLGHLAGDRLLIQIAHRLSQCLRSIDTVARLGGDEFAIIVTDLEGDEAASFVAERIQESLREPFDVEGHRVFTSASVGIALSSDNHRRAEDFLRDADTAMYRAKSQGRARHQLFDGHMHEQAMERLSIEAGVRRALERGELMLHYQPIISLETGNLVGVEALIRWDHPERGVLEPASFLAVAEESGLILPMSDWVVRTACEQASRWQRDLPEPTRISVNVPPQQLKHASFVQLIRDNLRRTGLPPSALGLELVESSLIENREAIVDNLSELRKMGIYIAIDDFGTGYSSLSYLKRLPIDALKIDRSFIQGVPSDVNDTAISTTIIAMARSLNLSVVAEGVETPQQADFLRSHGCPSAQGYFFSQPLSASDCSDFFLKSHHARPPPKRTTSSTSLRIRR
jgi:diguanylate cyclase (GGDEF)-like protein